MPDQFTQYAEGLESPALNAYSVTPNDSADLPTTTRFIWIGNGPGIVQVLFAGDTVPVILKGLREGCQIPMRVKRIYATGTYATSIVAMY